MAEQFVWTSLETAEGEIGPYLERVPSPLKNRPVQAGDLDAPRQGVTGDARVVLGNS